MSMLHGFAVLVGQALLLAVLLSMFPGKFVRDANKRRLLVAGLLVLGLFVPIYGLSVSQWLRSVVGDLSVISWLVFLHILLRRLQGAALLNDAATNYLFSAVIVLGLVLYPSALGVSGFDVYRLGYSPVWLAGMLSILAIVAWLGSARALAFVILLPLLAFNVRLFESTNLWDYLLDPVIFVYALVQMLPIRNWMPVKQAVKQGVQ